MSRPNRRCPVCGSSFHTAGRGVYCSRACQQSAYRARRQQALQPALAHPALQPGQSSVEQTIYECSECEVRYLGVRRCTDCNLMMRKLGPGGVCPHCDEPVLISELVQPTVQPMATAGRSQQL